MRIYRLTFMLFVIHLWTPLFAQNTNDLKVIDLDGIRGVFVPEAQYRILREDQKKGFTYYTNWKISEVQLNRSDSINITFQEEIKVLNHDAGLDSTSIADLQGLNTQCDSDLKDLVNENAGLRTKIKALPWIGVGAFILGGIVGVVASK